MKMGEIAEDCYDRALDEMEMLDANPDYFCEQYGGYGPRYRFPARYTIASLDDFDDLDA